MPYSQSELDALNSAIALGSRSLQYQDRKTEFRSLAEMLALKRIMEAELSGAVPSNSRNRILVPSSMSSGIVR